MRDFENLNANVDSVYREFVNDFTKWDRGVYTSGDIVKIFTEDLVELLMYKDELASMTVEASGLREAEYWVKTPSLMIKINEYAFRVSAEIKSFLEDAVSVR